MPASGRPCRHFQRAPERGEPKLVGDAPGALAGEEERRLRDLGHVDGALRRNPVGGETRRGLRRVDRRIDGEHAGVYPLGAELLRRRRASSRASRGAPPTRAPARRGVERRRVRDLDERAAAVRAQAPARRSRGRGTPDAPRRPSSARSLQVGVGDRAAAPDVARSHARDRDSVDDRVEPAEGLAASVSAASSCAASSTSAPIAWAPRRADGVESLVALRDRGAVPALCEGAIEDRAAEVPGAERDELRHQRLRGGLQSRLSCPTVEHELGFYFK